MSYEEMRFLGGLTGLLLLFAFFVGVLIFIFRPGARKKYDEASRIPLKED